MRNFHNNLFDFISSSLYDTDNSARCSSIYINKGVTIDVDAGTLMFEFEGNGPGIDAADTVNSFQCEVNDQPFRPCKS